MTTESNIPLLPNIIDTYNPTKPVSRIHEQKNIDEFVKTKAFDRIMTFVMLLNQSVAKKKITDPCSVSPVIHDSFFSVTSQLTIIIHIANSTYIRYARHYGFLVG
jgi:hypothetical protein